MNLLFVMGGLIDLCEAGSSAVLLPLSLPPLWEHHLFILLTPLVFPFKLGMYVVSLAVSLQWLRKNPPAASML